MGFFLPNLDFHDVVGVFFWVLRSLGTTQRNSLVYGLWGQVVGRRWLSLNFAHMLNATQLTVHGYGWKDMCQFAWRKDPSTESTSDCWTMTMLLSSCTSTASEGDKNNNLLCPFAARPPKLEVPSMINEIYWQKHERTQEKISHFSHEWAWPSVAFGAVNKSLKNIRKCHPCFDSFSCLPEFKKSVF